MNRFDIFDKPDQYNHLLDNSHLFKLDNNIPYLATYIAESSDIKEKMIKTPNFA